MKFHLGCCRDVAISAIRSLRAFGLPESTPVRYILTKLLPPLRPLGRIHMNSCIKSYLVSYLVSWMAKYMLIYILEHSDSGYYYQQWQPKRNSQFSS